MQLTSDFIFDAPADKPKPGSYEWWYFDATDETGDWQFVAIFYDGCPFSTRYNAKWENNAKDASAREHPAVTLSLYHKGKTVFYCMSEYRPKDAFFGTNNTIEGSSRITFKVGGNHIELCRLPDGNLRHTLLLDNLLPSGDALSGKIIFNSAAELTGLFKKNGSSKQVNSHGWNLTQPKANVEADLCLTEAGKSREIRWAGTGYHDHNLGSEPMKEEFTDWYWGRVHFKQHTLVYYLMNTDNFYKYKGWLIHDSGSMETVFDAGKLDNFSRNLFFLKTARIIELQSGSGDSCLIQQTKILDSGPFYYRFLSDVLIKSEKNGLLEKATGITEYIRPDRIHSRIFWPLVHMRYHYTDAPHWVQKSPTLFRWTW
ncbi:MAG: hypothetical protein LAT67_09450 [Balneolales bacterium]|nr:hypothetical protein [Balneolales bacterium]